MSLLPGSLEQAVAAALDEAGDRGGMRSVTPVFGGDINRAARIDTTAGSYFVKWNEEAPDGMFPMEARGLALLRSSNGPLVPEVLASSNVARTNSRSDRLPESHPSPRIGSGAGDEGQPGFLLESWIDAVPGAFSRTGDAFGEQLARFQRSTAGGSPRGYGLDANNFLGVALQANGWSEDWIEFFRERRIRHPAALAMRRRLIDSDLHRRLFLLADRLDTLLAGVERVPVLLHGDLWSGNVLFTREGRLALVDPAAYWGDREFDLATAEIYHAAPVGFWPAYEAVWPCAPGRRERRGIYHISLWLHCILCGQEYRYRIDSELRRYLG